MCNGNVKPMSEQQKQQMAASGMDVGPMNSTNRFLPANQPSPSSPNYVPAMSGSGPSAPPVGGSAGLTGTTYRGPGLGANYGAPIGQRNPQSGSPMQQGIVPMGVNPMQGWYGNFGGNMAQGWQGQPQTPAPQPQVAPTAPAPVTPPAQPQAAKAQSNEPGPQVRTQIVTGGRDIYRDALASELNKRGQIRKKLRGELGRI